MQDQFTYTRFHVNDDHRTVHFEYTLTHDGTEYSLDETIEFPVTLLETPEQQRALRALHLALGISYYKTFLPPTIVQPYAMDASEAAFWNDIWQHGLGEFLYVNKLPVERVAQFGTQDGLRFDGDSSEPAENKAILGIGGGKDSIVAGELLKDIGVAVDGFVMATGEQLGQTASVAKVMNVNLHAIKRQLDTQLLDLQKMPGAYSGHVPISLIFALVGTNLAIASHTAYVVVANEASASIPRIEWNGQAVNHQWSKSFGFEKDLQQFIHDEISAQVTYFSAVRQLTSIGVAKLFARLPQYFEVFTSDNFVFRMDPARRPAGRWSLESPKSLSSYLLLAPWLTDEEVQRIFTIDFMNQASLETLFLELVGVEGEPPLDCVGTVEELALSVNLLAQANRYTDTTLMKLAHERGVITDASWQDELQDLLRLSPEQALPEVLQATITRYLQEHTQA